MSIKISHPSKTFIIGEYAVMDGGDAMLMATSPRFCLTITDAEHTEIPTLHRDSPVYKLIQDHPTGFTNKALQFYDPHSGSGGFGYSSAQFLSVYHYLKMNQDHQIDILECLQTYYHYTGTTKGASPSGADLIAQHYGGVTHFNRHNLSTRTGAWPFPGLIAIVVSTGKKVATHHHLAKLVRKQPALLQSLAKSAILAQDQGDQEAWINSIRRFQDQLITEGLCVDHTRALIDQLYQESCVVACKGCGALGADVIMILAKEQNRTLVHDVCKRLNLKIVADSTNLSEGVQVVV